MDDAYGRIAAWYDIEHDAFTEDIEFYEEVLAEAHGPHARVLEIGSGTGRIAAALALAGHVVTGVEPSAAMRERCRRRLAALPERAARRFHLLAGDALAPGLPPESRFDAAIVGLNTLAHLTGRDERIAALRALRPHLDADALLMLDLDIASLRALADAPGQLRLQGRWTLPDDGRTLLHLVAAQAPDAATTVTLSHLYDVFAEGGTVERTTTSMRLALLSRGEVELLLLHTGYAVEAVYGGYDRSPCEEGSPRVLLVARPV